MIYGSHSVRALLLSSLSLSWFLWSSHHLLHSRRVRILLYLVSSLNFPWECFIVSLGILTATRVLSGLTLIAFGQGMLLNTHRNNRDWERYLREVSLVNSEALLFHSDIIGTTEPVNFLFGHTWQTVTQRAVEWCVSTQSHLYLSDFLWPNLRLCSLQWAHFFCGLQMAMSGFYWSIKGIFISFCISTVSALLISIRFLLTALEWKSPTKKG